MSSKMNLSQLTQLKVREQAPARTDFATKLKATMPKDMVVGQQRAEELEKVLSFWNSYACHELMQYASISDGKLEDGSVDPNLQGRVVLDIPATAFHTQTSGFFQLKLLWPRVNNETNDITCKLSLGYKIQPDGHATELTTGGRKLDGIEFTSINSPTYGLDDLFIHGYLDEEIEDRVMKFALNKLGENKAILTLVPQSNVLIVLRNTIRPLVDNPSLQIESKYAPGEDTGIGMAAIAFSEATLLPALTSLLNQKVVDRPRRSFTDLAEQYGARPVGQPVYQNSVEFLHANLPSSDF